MANRQSQSFDEEIAAAIFCNFDPVNSRVRHAHQPLMIELLDMW